MSSNKVTRSIVLVGWELFPVFCAFELIVGWKYNDVQQKIGRKNERTSHSCLRGEAALFAANQESRRATTKPNVCLCATDRIYDIPQ